jgi:fibronectin-binding autotransporter adhesin
MKIKTNMKNTSAPHTIRPSLKRVLVCALLTLTAPLALIAQQTVFYDTFGNSTINGGTNADMQPGGTPTASWTSYEIGSAKNATATTNSPGHFLLITSHTTSGNSEAQALFTKYPVTLAQIGDYIELDYTFTDTSNVLNSLCGNNVGLYCGLFDSGGVPPYSGTLLWNGGFGSATTADTAGTKNWLGYNAGMLNGLTGVYSWSISSRPAQTAQNNGNQQLLYGAQGGSTHSASPGTFPFPNLAIGSQYTVQLRITLSDVGALTVSNAMYAGDGVGGAIVFSNITTYTGANFLTTNFDGLAAGYRAGNSGSAGWTNDINSITVVAGLAAQAGPYFFVTSSGDPCSGGLTIGVSGSVTTNDYWLYLDAVNTGQSVAGTGSAVDFGLQTIAGDYTVVASNTVTGSEGPMLGSASVLAPGINIVKEPSSLTVVTNVTASFSVNAIGASLSYQWYANGAALANGGQISGAQSADLVITQPTAANVASGTNGYYCIMQTPCGDIATSSPPAALTLIAPRELTWQGGNGNVWDYTDTNFINSASSPQPFTDGDDVTFDNSSANTAVTLTNSVIPTLVTVNASQSYSFNDGSGVYAGKISGFGQLVDMGSGTLMIANDNNYTGGTIVSNGATLQLGDGSGTHGSVAGIVTVFTNGTLNYSFAGPGNNAPVNINNGFAGGGTVNFNDANGSIVATDPNIVSSNFNGTINIQGYTDLHASDNNAGYALGNGSTVNVPAYTQVWLDRSGTAYNNTFNIAGTGWQGATLQTGAMRVYNCTINGPINLTADARIGGSINGATIQSVISGPYQLEIWGNTNSFVLTMGPTNGMPQTYASTLVASGAIRAANSNAISPGALTLDTMGDLQLNGNNLTVASLQSVDTGLGGLGATIRNISGTSGAVLTVGTDGSSAEFDGELLDGGSQPLGLTKVGAGTLTLIGDNPATGPVTVNGGTLTLMSGISGSGSFSNATILAVADGATLNVSGRTDGTLTLNSGQTLEHSGAATGTINVNGKVNIGNGTLLLGIDHTGLASDSLAASGGITYSGTLAVTNIGAVLQQGDSFQLFGSGVSGFTSYNLETNDYVNNVKYTWDNTVASNGKVTVLSVGLLVNTNPTNISASVTGGDLTLQWPPDRTGWTLQAQTNALNGGLGTNWVDVAGSSGTNQMVIPIDPANGSVFYRMVYTNTP